MYYDERVIDGILCCRFSPRGEWRPVTHQEMTRRLLDAEAKVQRIYREVTTDIDGINRDEAMDVVSAVRELAKP